MNTSWYSLLQVLIYQSDILVQKHLITNVLILYKIASCEKIITV